MLRKSVVLGRLAVVLIACVQAMGRYRQAGKALPASQGAHPSDQQRRQRLAAWSA